MNEIQKIRRLRNLSLKVFILHSIIFTGNSFFYAEQSPLSRFLTSVIEVIIILVVDGIWTKLSNKKKDRND